MKGNSQEGFKKWNNINSHLKLTQIKKLGCQKNQSEFEELEQIKQRLFYSILQKLGDVFHLIPEYEWQMDK